jgi:3-methyladenine DNA glycosylase AlkD
MNFNETMRELESLGTEQNRKIWRRHGAPEPMFGVSFANLGKLQKRIKKDHALAQALWASGNVDARHLAVMVADPSLMTRKALEEWTKGLSYYGLTGLFVKHVASQSGHAREAMEAWMRSSQELVCRAGWELLATLSQQEGAMEDKELGPYLERIEQGIHTAQNRVREAMNSALIAIGARGGAVGNQALAVAKCIGKVEVDHGETGCKTPDATEYILKMRARASGKAGKATRPTKSASKAKPPARSKTARERTRPRA